MEKSSRYFTPLLLLTLAAIAAANYYIFMLVPTERMMGAVQRVFYFHVAAALASISLLGWCLSLACGFSQLAANGQIYFQLRQVKLVLFYAR